MARKRKQYFCVFCGAEIFPEAGEKATGQYYIFQCEDELCGANYESQGSQIPEINIIHRPTRVELDFSQTGDDHD
jgi:hypothetical protein